MVILNLFLSREVRFLSL